MKVKCDKFILPNGRRDCFHRLNGTCIDVACHMGEMLNVDIPTADLIAELEKRRPCVRCQSETDLKICSLCFWMKIFVLAHGTENNNFKEAK